MEAIKEEPDNKRNPMIREYLQIIQEWKERVREETMKGIQNAACMGLDGLPGWHPMKLYQILLRGYKASFDFMAPTRKNITRNEDILEMAQELRDTWPREFKHELPWGCPPATTVEKIERIIGNQQESVRMMRMSRCMWKKGTTMTCGSTKQNISELKKDFDDDGDTIAD